MSAFRRHASDQAAFCERAGAPFTALLCRMLGTCVDPRGSLGRRLDGWPGDPATDALALRLAGGLHAAVLEGRSPALASCYPPAPQPADALLRAALEPLLADAGLEDWLDSAPQTNEVGRSGPLAAGMLVVASETGLPLSLFELGAAAGLNLMPDRLALTLGSTRAGDPASPLALAPGWRGGSPPAVPLRIAGRRGVDLQPLAPVADATRLMAYIWPDQPERLARMRGALALAAVNPPLVETGDAAAFVEARAHSLQGVATLVFHSIAFQYFPAATRARIASHMASAGAEATAESPLAWLRYEMPDPAAPALPELRLTLWPGGADRLLGRGHAHGAFFEWLA